VVVAMLLGATHQVKLTGAPFSAVAKVGGAEDSQAVNERYSGVAAKFWDRLITGRDVLAGLVLINARESHALTQKACTALNHRCVRR